MSEDKCWRCGHKAKRCPVCGRTAFVYSKARVKKDVYGVRQDGWSCHACSWDDKR